MNQEQKFDSIIKKKVDEAEFPFDEQNWNKLSTQLDAERKIAAGRGWGKYLYLGLLFLGITSASIAVYKIQQPSGLKGNLSAIDNANENNSSGSNSQNLNVNNKQDKNSEDNLLADNNSITSEKNYSALADLSKNNSTNVESIFGENNKSAIGNIGSESKNVEASVNNSSSTISKEKAGVRSEKNSSSKTFNSKNNTGGNLNGKKDLANLAQGGAGSSEVGEMNVSTRNKTDLSGEVILEHNVLNRINARIPIVYSNRNVKLAAVKLPSWYDDDYHRKGKKRLSFLNAEVGGAYLLGWNSKAGKDGKGFNWYAGVNYGKFINKKIGFSLGSQFYNIGNIDESFYESTKAVYGLGSTSTNTIITTKALFYFAVPVKAYYAINSSNQIGVGVNPSFLFSSKNVVETYRLTDNIKSNEITSNSSGIYEGVKLNNVLVSVFYKAKITKRSCLNAEFLYGVRDIFKNSNSNNYTQKPLGVRLGVQFTLFEK